VAVQDLLEHLRAAHEMFTRRDRALQELGARAPCSDAARHARLTDRMIM
jgi:hypothetical protein